MCESTLILPRVSQCFNKRLSQQGWLVQSTGQFCGLQEQSRQVWKPQYSTHSNTQLSLLILSSQYANKHDYTPRTLLLWLTCLDCHREHDKSEKPQSQDTTSHRSDHEMANTVNESASPGTCWAQINGPEFYWCGKGHKVLGLIVHTTQSSPGFNKTVASQLDSDKILKDDWIIQASRQVDYCSLDYSWSTPRWQSLSH